MGGGDRLSWPMENMQTPEWPQVGFCYKVANLNARSSPGTLELQKEKLGMCCFYYLEEGHEQLISQKVLSTLSVAMALLEAEDEGSSAGLAWGFTLCLAAKLQGVFILFK
ncbi:hypothetical protein ATANTOWER_020611 [Ataeniobius toweri]|uniref:Uncharacterized protein n=1 Tax=Ataeniobius toweri TaxID=208326 RepID=A0ABU7CBP3_9TELE|nr:hypothetical protein [Ataeniobius toweri]